MGVAAFPEISQVGSLVGQRSRTCHSEQEHCVREGSCKSAGAGGPLPGRIEGTSRAVREYEGLGLHARFLPRASRLDANKFNIPCRSEWRDKNHPF